MSPHLFTIGHSTHPFDRFVAMLTQHGIKILADIRRFPGSRKFPQFNQDNLALALPNAGIEYRWLSALGGRRGKKANGLTSNLGLRNESFQNYADYMLIDSNSTVRFPLILLPHGSLERYIYVAAGQSNQKIIAKRKTQAKWSRSL